MTGVMGENRPTYASNVVINELLCFMVSRRRIMPDDTIVQLCKDFYEDVAVEEAKKILFSHYADKDDPRDRYISRSGDSKKQKHLRDMLDLLTRKGSKTDVIFAAVEITNMPSVSYNNIDVSALLMRMDSMEAEVSQLRKAVTTQETVCSDLHSITSKLALDVNKAQGSPCRPTEMLNSAEAKSNEEGGLILPTPGGMGCDDTTDGIAIDKQAGTWSNVVKKNRIINANKQRTEAPAAVSPVVKKRGSQKVVGRAKDVAIKPAKKRMRLANVFASKLDPDLDVEDLRSYLAKELSLPENSLSVELIRRTDWHTSFHIKCNCHDPSAFMNCDIWPEDAYVRWWREPKQSTSSSAGKASKASSDNTESTEDQDTQESSQMVHDAAAATALKQSATNADGSPSDTNPKVI